MKQTLLIFIGTILFHLGHSSDANAQLKRNYFSSYTPYQVGQSDFYLPPELKDSGEIHSPKKATIMSAIVPGLGQIYNEKYWKTGFIYISAGVLGYMYKYNTDSLKSYQLALEARIDGDSNTNDNKYPFFSDSKITTERDYYRNNRDRIIIGFVALYALQIIDANVDAHLREFEVNDDLSLRIDPRLNYDPLRGYQAQMSLTFTF